MTLGLAAKLAYVLAVYRARLEFPGLIDAVKREYARHRPQVILIEKRASGRSALQVLRRETTLPIVAVDPGGKDKVARARSVTPFYESGRVIHVADADADWLDVFEDELTMFPDAAHDDQVDALVYGLLRLMTTGSGIYV